MDDIFSDVRSISWWFNGFFFVLVSFVVPYIFKNIIPRVSGFFIIKPVRFIKAKRLKRIKKIRWSSVRISYEGAKCAALLSAFIVSFFVYFISMFSSLVIIMSNNSEDYLAVVDNVVFFRVVELSALLVVFIEIAYLSQRLFFRSVLCRSERVSPRM